MYSISAAAISLGVIVLPFAAGNATGRLISHRTFGNHRRYTFSSTPDLSGVLPIQNLMWM